MLLDPALFVTGNLRNLQATKRRNGISREHEIRPFKSSTRTVWLRAANGRRQPPRFPGKLMPEGAASRHGRPGEGATCRRSGVLQSTTGGSWLESMAMSDVTRILGQIESDDPSAAEQLLPLVYDEL